MLGKHGRLFARMRHARARPLLAAIVAAAVLMSSLVTTYAAPSVQDDTEQSEGINWSNVISPNADGTYTDTMSVTSPIITDTAPSVKSYIYLSLDASGSCAAYLENEVADAITHSGLQDFLDKTGSEVMICLQPEDTDSSPTIPRLTGWTSKLPSTNSLLDKIHEIQSDGMDNIELSIADAAEQLQAVKKKDPSAQTAMIVFGDGTGGVNAPTADSSALINKAKLCPANTVFAVMNYGDASYMRSFANKLKSAKLDSHYYDATNTPPSNIINEIIKVITKTQRNVSISNTLSAYADLAGTIPSDGNITSMVTLTIHDGSGKSISPPAGWSATYDKASKKITFALPATYDLVDKATYSFAFQVMPSQKAFDDRAANLVAGTGQDGYLHTGDPDTGASSAGMDGFFVSDSTQLSFSIYDGTTATPQTPVAFKIPVLQLPMSSISISKAWDDNNAADRPTSVQVLIKQDDKPFRNPITLTKDSGWKAEISNVPAGPDGHTYTVEEVKTNNYDVAYTPDQGKAVLKGIDGAKQALYTITNKRSAGQLIVNKYDANAQPNEKPLSGADFEVFTDTNNNGTYEPDVDQSAGKLMDNGDGTYTLNSLAFGKYFLVENTAPENYQTADVQPFDMNSSEVHLTVQDVHVLGTVILNKKGNDGNSPLEGVTFRLAAAKIDDGKWKEDDTTDFQPVTVTTGKDGKAEFTGLPYYGHYLVTETNGPEGYQVLETPLQITLDDTTCKNNIYTRDVYNKVNPALPSTGGIGYIVPITAGCAIGIGLFLYGIRRMRRRAS